MNETHAEFREARNHVGLCQNGVEPLVRDAVSVEDHPVSFLELKPALRHSRGCENQRPNTQDPDPPQESHRFPPNITNQEDPADSTSKAAVCQIRGGALRHTSG